MAPILDGVRRLAPSIDESCKYRGNHVITNQPSLISGSARDSRIALAVVQAPTTDFLMIFSRSMFRPSRWPSITFLIEKKRSMVIA